MKHCERAGLRFDVVDKGRRDGECFVLMRGFLARPRSIAAYAVEELVLDVIALADTADV